MTKPVYITHAKGTAFGSFMGSLSTILAPMLGCSFNKIYDIKQQNRPCFSK